MASSACGCTLNMVRFTEGLKIVQKKLEDTSFLYDIFDQEFSNKFEASSDAMWFLAYLKDILIGAMFVQQRNSQVWEFKGGYVDPDHRLKGVFRKMWEARMKYTLAQNPHIISGASNSGNRSIFESYGFKLIRTLSNGEVLMSKEITQ